MSQNFSKELDHSFTHVAQSLKKEQETQKMYFIDRVHDQFILKLHDSFLEAYGVAITNIRVESFKIVNSELSRNMSNQAFLTAQTQNQLANLVGQTEIAVAQQKRDAEVARIKAEGEAIKLTTETGAKNKAVMARATAEADAQVIKAKAEASSIEMKAEAESKSISICCVFCWLTSSNNAHRRRRS